MSITINNGVSNIKATPGIIADDYANIPAATNVATGTIFIDTVGLTIYRSESGGWFALGGGGGTPNFDAVLNQGNSTTNYCEFLGLPYRVAIDALNVSVEETTLNLSANLRYDKLQISYSNFNLYFDKGIFSTFNATNNTIKLDLQNDYIISTKYNPANAGEIEIGLKLDFLNDFYYLGNNSSGIFIDLDSQIYKFGDYDFGGANGTNILIDDAGSIISTRVAGSLEKGLYFDFINSLYKIGDFYATMNNTYLIINDANQKIELSNNLKSATAGGSAGQHLKINIGGTDYKIALLNP